MTISIETFELSLERNEPPSLAAPMTPITGIDARDGNAAKTTRAPKGSKSRARWSPPSTPSDRN